MRGRRGGAELEEEDEEILVCLAVQDSSIGDLVTHSVSQSVSKTFDFSDF